MDSFKCPRIILLEKHRHSENDHKQASGHGCYNHQIATATLAEAQAHLDFCVEQAENEGPIVITPNGKAVAVIVAPVDDDDLESLILARAPRFQALLKRSRESLLIVS